MNGAASIGSRPQDAEAKRLICRKKNVTWKVQTFTLNSRISSAYLSSQIYGHHNQECGGCDQQKQLRWLTC